LQKHTHNSFGIRSFKTQDLKPFRIRIYEKTGRDTLVDGTNQAAGPLGCI